MRRRDNEVEEDGDGRRGGEVEGGGGRCSSNKHTAVVLFQQLWRRGNRKADEADEADPPQPAHHHHHPLSSSPTTHTLPRTHIKRDGREREEPHPKKPHESALRAASQTDRVKCRAHPCSSSSRIEALPGRWRGMPSSSSAREPDSGVAVVPHQRSPRPVRTQHPHQRGIGGEGKVGGWDDGILRTVGIGWVGGKTGCDELERAGGAGDWLGGC